MQNEVEVRADTHLRQALWVSLEAGQIQKVPLDLQGWWEQVACPISNEGC